MTFPRISADIENLTLTELCELLVTNTTELLKILNSKAADAKLLRDKKGDVEKIQAAIAKKKVED